MNRAPPRVIGYAPEEVRMSLLQAAKHELKQVGLVTLYFLVCFLIVLTLKKLFLADYEIEFYALSAAVIGALIAGKVVVVLDKIHIGTQFDETHPIGLAVLYKTLCYSVVTFLVLAAEKLFHAYRDTGVLAAAVTDVWEHRNRNLILAKLIVIAAAYACYHLYAGIDRRLGEGTLWRELWAPANSRK